MVIIVLVVLFYDLAKLTGQVFTLQPEPSIWINQFAKGKTSMLFEVTRTNTILYCREWAETVAFYRDVLQFSVSYQKDWFIEFHIVGNIYLSVADEQRASINSASGEGITLSWQVMDIAQAHDDLRAHDISVTEVKQKWGALVCYFADPEGNRIEIWEAPQNT